MKKPKTRPTPYAKPILLKPDRRNRKKKSITWQADEKITSVRYFDLIEDERVNMHKINIENQQNEQQAGGSSLNNKMPSSKCESDKPIEYLAWRPLILIDFTPTLPSPGWNSIERSAQAEREVYVLGAIDLPGKPSTLDEPDAAATISKDDNSDIKIIPLDNPDGMFTEYPNMYNTDIVNGVRLPSDDPTPAMDMNHFLNLGQDPSQILPNQQATQANAQGQFPFQGVGGQYQQQQPHSFQQMPLPFVNLGQPQQIAQQQQQALTQPQPNNISGPIMPWLNFPFNQVSESSHVHLFRRPAT